MIQEKNGFNVLIDIIENKIKTFEFGNSLEYNENEEVINIDNILETNILNNNIIINKEILFIDLQKDFR